MKQIPTPAIAILADYDHVDEMKQFERVAERATDLIAALLNQIPQKELPESLDASNQQR